MITKVFQSGYSQAVRIPVSFRLDIDTVEILHGENSDIILRSFKPKADMEFLALFEGFDEDFIEALEKFQSINRLSYLNIIFSLLIN